jgi:hypothetical protein
VAGALTTRRRPHTFSGIKLSKVGGHGVSRIRVVRLNGTAKGHKLLRECCGICEANLEIFYPWSFNRLAFAKITCEMMGLCEEFWRIAEPCFFEGEIRLSAKFPICTISGNAPGNAPTTTQPCSLKRYVALGVHVLARGAVKGEIFSASMSPSFAFG